MTSTGMLGADPEELDELATFCDATAERLQTLSANVTARVRTSTWDGNDATNFRSDWNTRATRVVAQTVDLLVANGEILRRNAAAQRQTSAADDPLYAFLTGKVLPWLQGKAERLLWMAEQERMIAELRGKSAEEQARWWASLTPEEQDRLIASMPLALLSLSGLPPDARDKASRQAVEDMRRDIKVSEAEVKLEAEASIKIVKIGGGITATITEYADGTVKITLGGELGAGVGTPGGLPAEASAMLNAKSELVLAFGSKKEAEQFLIDLAKSPLPNEMSDLLRLGAPPAYAMDQMKDFLAANGHHYDTTRITGELEGKASVEIKGLGNVEIEGAAGATYDTTAKETTLYVEGSVKGTSFGPYSVAAESSARYELVLDQHGALDKVVVHTTGEAKTGSTSYDGSVQAHVGQRSELTIEVDAKDPANRAAAHQLLSSAASGDASGAGAALGRLYDGATVTAQTSVAASSEMGVDAKVAKVKGSITGTTAALTTVKPPYGTAQEVRR